MPHVLITLRLTLWKSEPYSEISGLVRCQRCSRPSGVCQGVYPGCYIGVPYGCLGAMVHGCLGAWTHESNSRPYESNRRVQRTVEVKHYYMIRVLFPGSARLTRGEVSCLLYRVLIGLRLVKYSDPASRIYPMWLSAVKILARGDKSAKTIGYR